LKSSLKNWEGNSKEEENVPIIAAFVELIEGLLNLD
jgi:hypothetical protein